MAYLYAFGETSRARGIDDIGQILWLPCTHKVLVRLGEQLLPYLLQNDYTGASSRPLSLQQLLGQQDRDLGLLHHRGQTRSWIAGIQRHIGPSCFEHG